MKSGDLRIIFALQDKLTRLSTSIRRKKEHIYESFPEVISIFSTSDLFERDGEGNSIIRENIIDTCRIRAEVMNETSDLQEKLAVFFPGSPVEVVESDIEKGKQGLCRVLARRSDQLDAIEDGYYMAVEMDEEGAYLNVGLRSDTPAARQLIRDVFPNERIVFLERAPFLDLKFG